MVETRYTAEEGFFIRRDRGRCLLTALLAVTISTPARELAAWMENILGRMVAYLQPILLLCTGRSFRHGNGLSWFNDIAARRMNGHSAHVACNIWPSPQQPRARKTLPSLVARSIIQAHANAHMTGKRAPGNACRHLHGFTLPAENSACHYLSRTNRSLPRTLHLPRHHGLA